MTHSPKSGFSLALEAWYAAKRSDSATFPDPLSDVQLDLEAPKRPHVAGNGASAGRLLEPSAASAPQTYDESPSGTQISELATESELSTWLSAGALRAHLELCARARQRDPACP